MGLKVWLPLTKDLHNQGTANVIMTNSGGTYSSSGGKLGGCYSFNGTNGNGLLSNSSPFTNSTDNWSYACWFKPNNSHNGCLFSCRNTVDTAGMTIFYYSGLWLFDDGARWQFTPSTNVTIGAWNHLVFTRQKGVGKKMYLNGNLVASESSNNTQSIVTTKFAIGDCQQDTNTLGGNPVNGSLNDIRIYDHVLSLEEIKELAKGLVLHYPLERRGLGQENLLKNTDFNGIAQKYTLSSGSEGGFTYTPSVNIPANTTYTVSCYMRGNANMVLYKLCDGGNEQVYWVNRNELSTTEYKKISITFSSPGTSKQLNQIYICTRYGNSNVGDWFEIKPYSLKMELGSIATPWCPNSSDALASEIGLNSNIEYDGSGFQNNGIRSGTFTWSSDVPPGGLYPVSMIFNGSDNAIQIPDLSTLIQDGTFTMSVWFWKDVIGSKGYQTIFGGPGGFELEARNSGEADPVIKLYSWGGGTTPYTFGEWYHLVFIRTTNDTKIYLNGELKLTGSAGSIPSGDYFVGAWKTSAQQNFQGKMADFRIYTTALSEADILSLYQNGAKVDINTNPITIYGKIR